MNLSRSKSHEINEFEAAAKRLQARLGGEVSGEDIAREVVRNRWERNFRDVLAGLKRPPVHPDRIRSVDAKRHCGLLGEDRDYVREMMIREYDAWRAFARQNAPHLLAAETANAEPSRDPGTASDVTWFK